MIHPAKSPIHRPLYRPLLLALVLSIGGCQSLAGGGDEAPSPAHSPPCAEALRQITDDDGAFVTKISPSGAIESFRKGHAEISRGQLSPSEMRELTLLFADWDQLPPSRSRPESAETISYGDKTIAVPSLEKAPDLFKRASKAIGHLAVRRCSPSVPMATHEDLDVGIATFTNKQDPAGKQQHVLAYLLNTSTHDVKVFVPGFVGPAFGNRSGEPEGVPYETRVGTRFGPGDFVCLRPGEAFSRVGANIPKFGAAFAYYILFPPGQEGDWTNSSGLLYPNGNWTPAPATQKHNPHRN